MCGQRLFGYISFVLVFVDESGDLGLKLDQNSSKHFTVVAVWFQDRESASDAERTIRGLRKQLGVADHFEFHFNSCSNRFRKSFLTAVSACDFSYFAMVINKRKLNGPGFQFGDSFYKCAVRFLFENMAPHLNNAKVVIDKCGERLFRQQLRTYLKRRINTDQGVKRIAEVQQEESRRSNLVQLADMVAGAVARSFRTDRADRGDYRALIRGREFNVRFWPQ